MIEIKRLSIKVKDRYLVKDLSFTLNKGDKLAVIGEEGNGKSTLLKSILGLCDYVDMDGVIDLKGNTIGYLEQTISNKFLDIKVYNYLFEDENDYYNKINIFYKSLDIINLKDNILEQKISTLSGGEKVKIGILKLLINDYDVLFLDEPTNDLDLETLNWLENFIKKIDKPIMFISHDEMLLSNTANMILHIEQVKKKKECRHTLLKIDFDTYVENRINLIDKQTQIAKSEKREFNKKQEKLMQIMQRVEHEQNVISRGNPHGAKLLKKKMKTLKSQEKKLDDSNLTEIPDVEESINFYFNNQQIPVNKMILKLDIPELRIKEKILSKNIKLDIIGNTHLCIIGNNGVGKSTLIKQIYQELKDRSDINIGYMPQNYDDILNKYEFVLDFLVESKKKEDITKALTYLGNMKFTKEEMMGKIKYLSNGTKAKLFLVKLVLDNSNVLILDEPTRNVSPLSNPVIRKALKEFNGTIISISHDRKYINEVIDELYELTSKGIKRVNLT